MNANRNNNRRRGRGNNRGPGGGSQGNRIDSRARGNAPQLLEKYKKLAHDASLNGDRVQTEYYLQFADHYFRVIADNRTQKDDGRGRRDAEREQSEDDGDQDEEFELPGRSSRRRGRDDEREDTGDSPEEGATGNESDTDEGEPRNPFIREARPKRTRARAAKPVAEGPSESAPDDAAPRNAPAAEESGFDPGVLPPSIKRADTDAKADEDKDEVRAEARPKRTRRPRQAKEDGGETLETVN